MGWKVIGWLQDTFDKVFEPGPTGNFIDPIGTRQKHMSGDKGSPIQGRGTPGHTTGKTVEQSEENDDQLTAE